MEKEKIKEEVIAIIAENIRVPQSHIDLSMAVGDVPEWGSMAQMAIITAIQSRFDIEIPPDDLFELMSVEDIVNEVSHLIFDR